MFSFRPKANNHAIAAARASSPTPKDPKSPIKPARPKASPRKSSSGETPPSSPTPIARSQTSYFSKQQTPLRAAETVYYDAQSNPPTAPPGTVIITFSKPGVLPPLYVTTSMTDWELHEMAYTVIPSHGKEQVVFHKDFLDAQPGQHMYRFRVGRKTWIVDDACEVGRDDNGTEHNIIRVDKKSDSVQVPLSSSLLPASIATTNEMGMLTQLGAQPIIGTTSDTKIEDRTAQLTAVATDVLQTKAEELPLPHNDPAQFSELAVSPPANETLHTQGILGNAIETAMLSTGSSGGSASPAQPADASAGRPIADTNAPAAGGSTSMQAPALNTRTTADLKDKEKDDPVKSSSSLATDSTASSTVVNNAIPPEASDSSNVSSRAGNNVDDSAKQIGTLNPIPEPISGDTKASTVPDINLGLPLALKASTPVSAQEIEESEIDVQIELELELERVSARLSVPNNAYSATDDVFETHGEPAQIAVELGTIEEVPEVADGMADAVQTTHSGKKRHHRHSRLREIGQWVSVGGLLLGGAITGVLVGLFILHMLDGQDVAPVLESVERLEGL